MTHEESNAVLTDIKVDTKSIRDLMGRLMDEIDGSRKESEEAIQRIMATVTDPVERGIRVQHHDCLHIVRTTDMRLELEYLKQALDRL
jgi:2-hydroxy-3-keto-5-methylthiopentenyl-1-phosphate phosphatase